jgi:hypothetical protein
MKRFFRVLMALLLAAAVLATVLLLRPMIDRIVTWADHALHPQKRPAKALNCLRQTSSLSGGFAEENSYGTLFSEENNRDELAEKLNIALE